MVLTGAFMVVEKIGKLEENAFFLSVLKRMPMGFSSRLVSTGS